jgi:hypothetical protein
VLGRAAQVITGIAVQARAVSVLVGEVVVHRERGPGRWRRVAVAGLLVAQEVHVGAEEARLGAPPAE